MLKASATDSTTQKLISLNSTDTEASTFFEVSGINESDCRGQDITSLTFRFGQV